MKRCGTLLAIIQALACNAEVQSGPVPSDPFQPLAADASARRPSPSAASPTLGGPPVDMSRPLAPSGPLKVLFIGNSFSESNLLHLMFQRIAQGAGKTIVVDSYYEGGITLERLWTLSQAKVLAKINSNDWDFVVLQPWDAIAKDTVKWAPLFMEAIKKRNAQARTLIYMVNWEPLPKPGVVQSDQLQLEAFVAQHPGATLVPVIWAWVAGMIQQPEKSKDDKPYLWLSGDHWHPGRRRTYLAAISIHATIFSTSPVGLDGDPTGIKLPAADAAYLQGLAWDALRQHSSDPLLRQ